MTDKEKAKAYDEALEKARKELNTCGSLDCDAARQILRLFPQLRESEDEKIRKEIVSVIQKHYPNTPESYRWISWLEKQKEQKPIDDRAFEEWIDDWWKHNKINNPESYDKGDEIQFDEKGFKNFCRGIRNMYNKPAECKATINGKPISTENQSIDIPLVEWSDEDEASYNTFMCEVVNEKMNPTIEQIKWLRGIRDRFKSFHLIKQEWSDEDEKIRNAILGFLNPNKGGTKYSSNAELVEWSNWLKSLRPQPKQEWNTHDKAIVNCIVCCLDGQFVSEVARKQSLAWFNKHRRDFLNSTSWKPSKEQMDGLAHAINLDVYDAKRYGLESLYNDLKKLM